MLKNDLPTRSMIYEILKLNRYRSRSNNWYQIFLILNWIDKHALRRTLSTTYKHGSETNNCININSPSARKLDTWLLANTNWPIFFTPMTERIHLLKRKLHVIIIIIILTHNIFTNEMKNPENLNKKHSIFNLSIDVKKNKRTLKEKRSL